MSSYSSKVRSVNEEYSSNDDEQGKGRYQDLLDSVQAEMGSPSENEFAEDCGKIWGKARPKSHLGDEFKNILIPSNCSYLKTPYLTLKSITSCMMQPQIARRVHAGSKGHMSRPQFL